MASLQDLRRRISSVRNTRKITKALELVAGARLRRAQSRIEEMRPYADRMQELMVGTARAASSLRNLALLQQRDEVRRVAFVVVTGDRGLAGKPGYHDAQAVGHKLAELYEAEEVDRVVLIYNRFESALFQRVTTTDLLPIREEVLAGDEEEREGPSADFIYEPEPEQILQRLLPVYLETEIYRALLESAAAFLASQMTAMRNASKNAGELIDNLTLSLNRARQAEITQEILEVVAGADALTG